MIWVYLACFTVWAVFLFLVSKTVDTAERVAQIERILAGILNEMEKSKNADGTRN